MSNNLVPGGKKWPKIKKQQFHLKTNFDGCYWNEVRVYYYPINLFSCSCTRSLQPKKQPYY